MALPPKPKKGPSVTIKTKKIGPPPKAPAKYGKGDKRMGIA